MHREMDAMRTTRSVAVLERQLPAIRSELVEQRRFRMEQLEELKVDSAEAAATADGPRLQITRVLESAAEWALGEIEAALQRLEDGSYGICEHCAETDPMGAAGRAAGDQTLYPLSVRRRVGRFRGSAVSQPRSGNRTR